MEKWLFTVLKANDAAMTNILLTKPWVKNVMRKCVMMHHISIFNDKVGSESANLIGAKHENSEHHLCSFGTIFNARTSFNGSSERILSGKPSPKSFNTEHCLCSNRVICRVVCRLPLA